MLFRSRSIAREIASAVAVLAIYVLVLLSPWHQAAGLQHDLAELGYSSSSTWSICTAASPDDGERQTPAEIKCPAAGIGKHEFVATEPRSIDLDRRLTATATSYLVKPDLWHPTIAPHGGQARAPPVNV